MHRLLRLRQGVRGLLLAAMLAAAGCSGGGNGGAGFTAQPPVGNERAAGTVRGGQQPIRGATVTLYAAGSGGYGQGTALTPTATTDAGGAWDISFNCPQAGTLIYVVVSGGDAGGGANSAIGLSASLGPCGQGTLPTNANVDEVTTVAAVYALNQFLGADGRNPGTSAANATGLGNAAGIAADLANVQSGQAETSLPIGANGTLPSATLNTLANILSGCVNSSGPASTQCSTLFAAATPPSLAQNTASAPSTTLQAALNIARNPGNNVAALFGLATANQPFESPAPLSSAPGDWTLAITFTGGGLNEPNAVAVDAQGNVWVGDYTRAEASGSDLAGAVSKFAPNGVALSGTTGYTGGGLYEVYALAVDTAGNAWVTNQESPANVNSKRGSITKLGPDGAFLSPSSGYTGGGINFPESIAIDGAGNAWIGNFAGASVTELAADGGARSPAAGFAGGGQSFPVSLAVDASGTVWISNSGNNSITALSSAGAALSPATGYTGGGLNAPQGLCLDGGGDIWVANSLSNSVSELLGGGSGAAGQPVSPASGYGGGGLDSPQACAADGRGNIWVSNNHGSSISVLHGAGNGAGTPLTPSSGYLQGQLSLPSGVAIDGSGNVWIADFAQNSLVMLPGAAAPVKTPLIGLALLP